MEENIYLNRNIRTLNDEEVKKIFIEEVKKQSKLLDKSFYAAATDPNNLNLEFGVYPVVCINAELIIKYRYKTEQLEGTGNVIVHGDSSNNFTAREETAYFTHYGSEEEPYRYDNSYDCSGRMNKNPTNKVPSQNSYPQSYNDNYISVNKSDIGGLPTYEVETSKDFLYRIKNDEALKKEKCERFKKKDAAHILMNIKKCEIEDISFANEPDNFVVNVYYVPVHTITLTHNGKQFVMELDDSLKKFSVTPFPNSVLATVQENVFKGITIVSAVFAAIWCAVCIYFTFKCFWYPHEWPSAVIFGLIMNIPTLVAAFVGCSILKNAHKHINHKKHNYGAAFCKYALGLLILLGITIPMYLLAINVIPNHAILNEFYGDFGYWEWKIYGY